MSKMLTVAQVAEILGLKESTIRAWIAKRRIGIVRLGRSIRINVEETNRLIAEGTSQKSASKVNPRTHFRNTAPPPASEPCTNHRP